MKLKQSVAAALVFVSAGAVHAASTGTLNLRGTVNAVYNIAIAPESGGANLNLDILNGESDKLVATVNELSNDPSGYKVQASSANGGILKNGSVDQVAYSIRYGSGSTTTLSTSAQTVYTSSALVTPANNFQSVKVSFTGNSSALAGVYSDTITFSISAP